MSQEFTPTLFSLIFIGQILMLKKTIPLASHINDEFVPHFLKYHQEHLISGSLSTLRELISIHAYDMSITANQHSKSICHWSQDWSQLYYKEHIISMEKLQSMLKPIIQLAHMEWESVTSVRFVLLGLSNLFPNEDIQQSSSAEH